MSISRVTKVVKGGKKLSFRAVVVVGNGNGKIGVGCSKAAEVITAVQKAVIDAKKNMITPPMNKDASVPHEVTCKFKVSGERFCCGGTTRGPLEAPAPHRPARRAVGVLQGRTCKRALARTRVLSECRSCDPAQRSPPALSRSLARGNALARGRVLTP